jgi:hypothetical protein
MLLACVGLHFLPDALPLMSFWLVGDLSLWCSSSLVGTLSLHLNWLMLCHRGYAARLVGALPPLPSLQRMLYRCDRALSGCLTIILRFVALPRHHWRQYILFGRFGSSGGRIWVALVVLVPADGPHCRRRELLIVLPSFSPLFVVSVVSTEC